MSHPSIQKSRAQRREAVEYLKQRTRLRPDYLIVLGTGLGPLADDIEAETVISYADIPHFAEATINEHAGRLIFGKLGDKEVAAMQGRFHFYEGYTMQQVVFPIRVLKELSAQTLFVSNACGGMNPNFSRGDIMLITDHINFMGYNPLIGPNDEELGPRFPDMSEPYTERLLELAETVALEESIKLHQGVYMGVSGPTLETKAEYRFMRLLGADAVGMSTIPEVIAAVHMGMDVLGISAVTDECFPDALEPVYLEDVIEAAGIAAPKIAHLFNSILKKL